MKLLNLLTCVLFLMSFCTPVAFGFVAVTSLRTIPGYCGNKATNRYSEQPVKGILFTSPFLRSEIRGQSALIDSCDGLRPIVNSNFPKRGAFGLVMRSFPGRKSQEKRQLAQTHHALSKVLVLNASYEPLSVVTATRALSLLWDQKASLVVANGRVLKSCGGNEMEMPSVVCLRKYIKVKPKTPPLNRRTVLMRDGGKCQYCGRRAENMDHVIPRCRGGITSWENVVASCAPCNTRKAGFLLKDTTLKLRKQPCLPRQLSWVYGAVWKVDPRWTPYIGHAEDILADYDAAAEGRRRAMHRTSQAAEAALHAYGAAASITMDS